MTTASEEEIRQECLAIGEYLTGRPIPKALCKRYVDANGILFAADKEISAERVIVQFVRRHTWTLPYLDARLGLFQPDSLLRRKILLMTAILETTPEFTDAFLPERVSRHRLLLSVVGYGILSVVKLIIGMALYPLAVYSK